MTKVALRESPCGSDVTFEKVKPFQDVDRLPPLRLVPLIVPGTFVPGAPLVGVMLVIVGEPLFSMEKLKVVEPPLAVTVTGAVPAVADDVMLKVAVTYEPL